MLSTIKVLDSGLRKLAQLHVLFARNWSDPNSPGKGTARSNLSALTEAYYVKVVDSRCIAYKKVTNHECSSAYC